jgi:transmembrane sensor
MSHPEDKRSLEEEARCEQAVEWFLRMRSESARLEDLPDLQRWIEADPLNALAYRQVSATWTTFDEVASSPAIVVGRRDALEDAHQARQQRGASRSSDASKASARRQMSLAAIAASAVLVLALCVWFLTGPQWHSYSTNIGERRTVTLPDGSVMTLDARSRVRFKYTDKERRISFEQGQARFAVAKDPARPFRVRALDRTVVALGTNFNVERVSNTLFVTLIEGRVAVAPSASFDNGKSPAPAPDSGSAAFYRGGTRNESGLGQPGVAGVIELTAGEGLRILDGRAMLVPKIDLERVTAWQSGKLLFDNEPLVSAAERVNRYARRPIKVDPSVATVGISGVFNSGDADAFVEAVTAYFPVEVDATDTAEIRLIRRH